MRRIHFAGLTLIFAFIAILSSSFASGKSCSDLLSGSEEAKMYDDYSGDKKKKKKRYRNAKDASKNTDSRRSRNTRVNRRNKYKYNWVRKNRRARVNYRFDHSGRRRGNSFRY